MSLDREAPTNQRDAWIGGGLAGDSNPGMPDIEGPALQIDHSSDFEDDEARTRVLQGAAKRAWTVSGERGDPKYPIEPPDSRFG
ncbi:MAG TPA: hypothetical protein VNN25_01585 [Thermoanaerobaculia bacterium]|nr:hypothetical protein [Thermoanaerobaculia bacterium]